MTSSKTKPWDGAAVKRTIARKSITPTDEQQAINGCDDDLIVGNAFAGTGKTSTLELYTRSRPSERFLYVAFNKALQLEAERRFGSNTVCRTTHALAFPRFGAMYSGKLGSIRALDVSERLKISFNDARVVVNVLNNYISSKHRIISDVHLPDAGIQAVEVDRYLKLANEAWRASIDIKDEMPIPHDGYLKLYALSNPDLSARFSVILFDEAQDANPVTSQIIMNQSSSRIVMMGDRYQSIYAFRGARNAMSDDIIADASKFYLTKSFRFGEGIANVASMLLNDFHAEERQIQGLGKHQKSAFSVSKSNPYAVLTRTNGGLFRNCIKMVRERTPFCLISGIDNYNFAQIEDAYHLFNHEPKKVRDAFLKRFDSFAKFSDYADETEDISCQSLVKIVDEVRHDIPSLLMKIRSAVLPDSEQGRAAANVLMCTAHRSKGLEFDQVVLDNDFPSLLDDETGEPIFATSVAEQQEVNLLYVAVTRAERAIQLNETLNDYLAWKRENQEMSRGARTSCTTS